MVVSFQPNGGGFRWQMGRMGQEKDVILKNEPEKLLKTQEQTKKTNRNEPENEAEKLLKTLGC